MLRTPQRTAKDDFAFLANKTIYYLQFDHPLFNPLQLRLKLEKNAPDRLVVKAPIEG